MDQQAPEAETKTDRRGGDRAKNDRFERTKGYISKVTREDLNELYGVDWEEQRPTRVDLSESRFKLETLGKPNEKDEAESGLLHPKLTRTRIELVDVSDNRLTDLSVLSQANQFIMLNALIARHNLITELNMDLPTLVELNLAHNCLERLPSFSSIANLEYLILSHNRLRGTIESFRECKRLKRLDIAYNNYDWTPSQLSEALGVLKNVSELHVLRMYNNPFIKYFQEYQVFVVQTLKSLHSLDDVKISRTLREDIKNKYLLDLACYETPFAQRKKAEESRIAADPSHSMAPRRPRMKHMMDMLEEALCDPTSLAANIQQVSQDSEYCLASAHSDTMNYDADEVFWSEMPSGEIDAGINHFLELLLALMERHDSVTNSVINILGNLSVVVKYDMGVNCLITLGAVRANSTHNEKEVHRTLSEIVVPTLEAASEIDRTSDITKTMINGIVQMMQQGESAQMVAKAITHLVPKLAECFENCAARLQDEDHIVRLLAYTTNIKENVQLIATVNMAHQCALHLDNRSIAENEDLRELWLDVLRLAQNLIQDGPDEVAEKFQKEQLHGKLVAKAKLTWIQNNPNDVPSEATTLSRILDFLCTFMAKSDQVLMDCCKSYRFVEFVCQLLKKHTLDPYILKSACDCVTTILSNGDAYQEHADFIVEELGKVTPLLEFLGGRKYDDLVKRAARHRRRSEGTGTQLDEEPDDGDTPLANLKEPAVVAVFIAIIKLIRLFADEKSGDEVKADVNSAMKKNKRDKTLLGLLAVNDDDLRLQVMKCIQTVPESQISPEEMGLIIKRLSATRNIAEGHAEDVLALVVKKLEKLVENEGLAGKQFNQSYAEVAIAESYEVLYRNAQRATYGQEDEEEQKITLSVAIISFLRTCSRRPNLKKFLRNYHMDVTMQHILKWEETLNSPMAKDVPIEQCWLGRSLVTLMRSFTGDYALSVSKKVALRVLGRLADVIEGRTDEPIGGKPFRSEGIPFSEVAANEERIWDVRDIERNLLLLGDEETKVRRTEMRDFVRRRLLIQVIDYLNVQRIDGREFEKEQFLKEGRIKRISFEAKALEKELVIKRKAEEDRLKNKPEDVKLEDEEKTPYANKEGGEVIMIANMQMEDHITSDMEQFFIHRPKTFELDPGVWRDPERGEVKITYPVAAALRIIHGLMVVPISESERRTVLEELRKPKTLMKLLVLVESCPSCLSCSVAAKFLRIASLALDQDANVLVRHAQPELEIYKVVSMYVQTIAGDMLHLLRSTKDKMLDAQEQELCYEMTDFMGTAMRAVRLKIFSEDPEVQRQIVSDCIHDGAEAWLAPEVIIRLAITMALYDIQLDCGGGTRQQINDDFVHLTYNKISMKNPVTHFLGTLLVCCPDQRYHVLEVFSAAQVFRKMTVRASYLMELLREVNMGHYAITVEEFLNEKRKETQDISSEPERVLLLGMVEVAETGRPNVLVTRLLCATTYAVYLLQPDKDAPPYTPDYERSEWDPSWEYVYPRYPKIIWQHEVSTIDRIYRCSGTQALAIRWRRSEGSGVDEKNNHSIFIFRRQSVREVALNRLRTLSATKQRLAAMDESEEENKFGWEVCKVINDSGFRNDVKEVTGQEEILALTVGKPVFLGNWGGKPQDQDVKDRTIGQSKMFVLTMQKIYSFSINLAVWQPQDDEENTLDEGVFNPMLSIKSHEDEAMAISDNHGEEPDIQTSKKAPRHIPKPDTKNPNPVLKKDKEWPLPPKEVVFETEECDMSICCRSDYCSIRFFDDTAREEWRKALAYYLAETQTSWEREQ